MKIKIFCVATAVLFLQFSLIFAGSNTQPPQGQTEKTEQLNFSPQEMNDPGLYQRSSPVSCFSLYETGKPSLPGEKDPFIAGLLSWFMLGIGQIYVQEYTKGSLFIAAGFVDKAALVLLISHINTKYAPSDNEIVNINWKSFDGSTKFLVISYLAGTLGLRLYSVIDAVQSARNYNERYYSHSKKGGLSFSLDNDTFSLNYNFRFSD